MRANIVLTLLLVTAVMAACTGEKASLVRPDGAAPYYTSLADAQQAATADQLIVLDFYTDT